MNNGGDVLARGNATAQFAGASSTITDFENDFIYMTVVEITTKYGLTLEEYDQYAALRAEGKHLPDLTSVELQEKLDVGFSVTDHRKNYLATDEEDVKAVKVPAKKFPDPVYEPIQTLMDRIMVMVISDDPNVVLLEDGSTLNKTTGIIQTAKYRQHSNVGIVLLAGQWVITGGVKTPLSDLVKPGDKVIYGDYGSEKLSDVFDKKAEALCENLGVNYEKTEQGIRIVRIQDVRTIERRTVTNV